MPGSPVLLEKPATPNPAARKAMEEEEEEEIIHYDHTASKEGL